MSLSHECRHQNGKYKLLKRVIKSCIDNKLIQEAISEYESFETYETKEMMKAKPARVLRSMISICDNVLGGGFKYTGGNYYRHSIPYLPHTDYRRDEDNSINVVVPLSYSGATPSLIVFDQSWLGDSVTWCLDYEVHAFSINTGVKGAPYEYKEVVGLTKNAIDEDFYSKYLSHHRKDCFFGMSGEAFRFQPNDIIVFDNRLIHCTSSFLGEKLGLSLRFKKI